MSVCVRCGEAVNRDATVRLPEGRVCWSCDTRRCLHCGRKFEDHSCVENRCPGPARSQFLATRWRALKVDAGRAWLNCASLEDWDPRRGRAPAETWRPVEVVERYEFDGAPRLRVRILAGPEAGRVVSGLSPGNLREAPP